jgi:DNA primase small subunit
MDGPSTTPEVMLTFYKRLYPFKSLFNWLNREHNPTRLFTQREFAFTLENDVYLRYNSFKDADDLKKQIEKLNPSRFEIGAVYNARVSAQRRNQPPILTTLPQPKDKKSLRPGHLQPLKRELVFDIDMTDYDSIRTCCSGKGICRRCWGFIAAAVTVLDRALREDFGFNYILWVYSGRRGIHCWVSDHGAMDLTDDQRRSIMGYLEVVKGGKDQTKKVNVRGHPKEKDVIKTLYPSLKHSLTKLSEEYFVGLILEDQDCFADEQGWEIFLELIPDNEIVENLRKQWSSKSSDSSSKWEDFKYQIKAIPKDSPKRVRLPIPQEKLTLNMRIGPTSRGDGGYYTTIHLPSSRCRSIEAPQPLAESSVLRAPCNRYIESGQILLVADQQLACRSYLHSSQSRRSRAI